MYTEAFTYSLYTPKPDPWARREAVYESKGIEWNPRGLRMHRGIEITAFSPLQRKIGQDTQRKTALNRIRIAAAQIGKEVSRKEPLPEFTMCEYREMAEVLETTAAAVKQLVYRARRIWVAFWAYLKARNSDWLTSKLHGKSGNTCVRLEAIYKLYYTYFPLIRSNSTLPRSNIWVEYNHSTGDRYQYTLHTLLENIGKDIPCI